MLVVAAGYVAVTVPMAQIAARSDPAFAHRLAPYDGRITARLAAAVGDEATTPAGRAQADALARRALRQDPTAVTAVATLGLDADVRGDVAGARRLFAYALSLSRRDLKTQLWAIEDAVARGDVRGALRNYDIALRTHPYLADLLFPVLANASADAGVRREVVRTLRARPSWGESFIGNVAARAGDPVVTAQLFVELAQARVPVPPIAQASAIDALVNAGRLDQAWRYYATVRPGSDRRRSRDPRFVADGDAASLLDWKAITEGGAAASAQDGAFEFAVPASAGGPLLQQVQLLPPGDYRLAGRSERIEQVETARPYWSLQCRADKRELGRVAMPNSGVGRGRFEGGLVVPADCPVQMLILIARPSDAIGGVAGRIDQVELTSVRP